MKLALIDIHLTLTCLEKATMIRFLNKAQCSEKLLGKIDIQYVAAPKSHPSEGWIYESLCYMSVQVTFVQVWAAPSHWLENTRLRNKDG